MEEEEDDDDDEEEEEEEEDEDEEAAAAAAATAPAQSEATLFVLLASARLARFVGTLLDLGAQAVEDVAELSGEELAEVVGMDADEVGRLRAALDRWRANEPLGTGADGEL